MTSVEGGKYFKHLSAETLNADTAGVGERARGRYCLAFFLACSCHAPPVMELSSLNWNCTIIVTKLKHRLSITKEKVQFQLCM